MTILRPLSFLLVTLTVAPAFADNGWVPVPADPGTIPAGGICPFAVKLEPLKNEVLSNTVSTYPDGSPRDVLYKGDLVERITNLDTGRAVERDSGAFGIQHINEDGSQIWSFFGPIVWGLTNQGHITQGLYSMTGTHVIKQSATSALLLVDDGPKEDLCSTLR
jgi:hypothetical protein